MPGLYPPPAVATRFSVRALEILDPADPNAEARRRAVRQLFNWDSYARLYREYVTSVEPYDSLLSREHKMDLLVEVRRAIAHPHHLTNAMSGTMAI